MQPTTKVPVSGIPQSARRRARADGIEPQAVDVHHVGDHGHPGRPGRRWPGPSPACPRRRPGSRSGAARREPGRAGAPHRGAAAPGLGPTRPRQSSPVSRRGKQGAQELLLFEVQQRDRHRLLSSSAPGRQPPEDHRGRGRGDPDHASPRQLRVRDRYAAPSRPRSPPSSGRLVSSTTSWPRCCRAEREDPRWRTRLRLASVRRLNGGDPADVHGTGAVYGPRRRRSYSRPRRAANTPGTAWTRR